jgi:hypothetical protein
LCAGRKSRLRRDSKMAAYANSIAAVVRSQRPEQRTSRHA